MYRVSIFLLLPALFAFAADTVSTAPDRPRLDPELSPPIVIYAGAQPIDVEVGHAAPCFDDFDRDGKLDLLVGQFGGGKLRIYKNVGSNNLPRFDNYEFFKAGAELGVVPSG
jgi:hypothetical protein